MLIDSNQLPRFLSGTHLFGKLSEDQLNYLAGGVTTRLFDRGTVIYAIASEATEFYLIYSGTVRIERSVEGEQDYVVELAPGDYFSQEVLTSEFHRTAALATEETILIVFDDDFLQEIIRDNQLLKTRLDLITRSYGLMWNSPLGWRETDETVYYYARRHIFVLLLRLGGPLLLTLLALPIALIGEALLPAMITPLLLAGLSVSIAVLWGIWIYIDWTNDYFIITDRRVVYLERVVFLYDSRTEAPMEAVLSVNKSTSQIGRILHFGDLSVRSYTGIVPMKNIAYPEEVQSIIEFLLFRAKNRQTQEEKRSIDSTIRTRLSSNYKPEPIPVPVETTPANPVSVQPGSLQMFLVNFLHLRFEQNGIITYRKHWFILLQQVWWPSIILLALFIVLIARLFGFYEFISIGAVFSLFFALGLVTGTWWLYQYLDWSNDIYVVTQDQLIDIDKKPLGTESRKSAPLKNILSIEYERLGFIGVLLNYGTVYIKIGETTFTFDTVYNPSEVQRDLFKRFNELRYRERQAQDAADRRRMADWIESYHHWLQQHGPQNPTWPDSNPPGPVNPGPFSR